MPITPSDSAETPPCSHERGRGTTICLRCRAEANSRASAKRLRLASRAIAAVSLTGVFVTGARALAARTAIGNNAVSVHSSSHTSSPTSSSARLATLAERPAVVLPVQASHARVLPTVQAGRTSLANGVYVERVGDSVTVHFDTPLLRTRRAAKFEEIVRRSLPAVYGVAADSALAGVADGAMLSESDLVNELPTRGLSLPSSMGTTLRVWPITRPGQNGPLVVSYRVSVEP